MLLQRENNIQIKNFLLMLKILERFIPRVLRLHKMKQLERRRSLPGVPQGLSLNLLKTIGREVFCSNIQKVSHIHLSGWKQTGAFRLLLILDNQVEASLVYKVAYYGSDEIPALRGLPVLPGLPEFLVLSLKNAPLEKFLPTVYWSEKRQADKIYRYICEDLSVEYRCLSRSLIMEKDVLFAAEKLPLLQHAIEISLGEKEKKQLLRFDNKYSVALLKYAYDSIKTYAKVTRDPTALGVLRRWPELDKVYKRNEFVKKRPDGFIHGDFNTSNIYISKNGKKMKVIDWEWAGLGIPHADLVSLSKGCSRLIQREALTRFIKHFGGSSYIEQMNWIQLCRLERGLLDAAFLARQQLESKRSVKWIPDRISQKIREIINVCEELA